MGLKQEFKKTVKSLVRWALSDEADSHDYNKSSVSPVNISSMHMKSSSSPSINELNRGMNFSVYNATGGKVIQIHSYDPRTDRTNSSLYIITDQEDMGEELAQIITKESLSR